MPPETEVRFEAMGATAHVVVLGPSSLLDRASRRIEDLESKWSRFRPTSEVARLDGARDAPLAVSADTRALVRHSVQAWSLTDGAFDPSILDALRAWGYDRTFDAVTAKEQVPSTGAAPGLASVEVDERAGTVLLGGAGFDPGGIGKGLAADIVAEELIDAGADAALVNLGGDLRIAGSPPPSGWVIAVEDPLHPSCDLARHALTDGAVATSSDRRRRWRVAGHEAHHLIDPGSGRPCTSAWAGVAIFAGAAWWAEALTKAVLIGRLDLDGLPALGALGIGRLRTGERVGVRSAAAEPGAVP
jgi:thiamine biosynthesis lipoprotein